MAVTPKEEREIKREKRVLKLLSEYEEKGLSKTKAVLLIAEALDYSERSIYSIIKKSKEHEQSKPTKS